MQNEEVQRVFNISEHQNHRYNGFVLPATEEKSPVKSKKQLPKVKKNVSSNMVTAANKNVLKRKSKVKISANKNEDTALLNGISPFNNTVPNKEIVSYIDNFRPNSYEHLSPHSVGSVNKLLSNLNNADTDVNVHNRMRVANLIKYSDVNHTQNVNTSVDGVSYSKIGSGYSEAENEPKVKRNNSSSPNASKFTSPNSVGKVKKTFELKEEGELSPFQQEIAPYKSMPLNNPQSNGVPMQEGRFMDNRKTVVTEKEEEKYVFEASSSRICENKLFLRAKRRKLKSKWQMDNGTRHEALQRIRQSIEMQENLQNDLFPLNIGETGFEKSDSDSSEEYASTFQKTWFHSMTEIEFDDVKRSFRLSQLYNELRRQWCQIKQNKCELPTLTEKFMKSIVDTARTRPCDALYSIEQGEKQASKTEPLILIKKKCSVDNCKNITLPCMPTCVRHILHCEKQTLFEQCRVRDSNSFQCDRPVFNIHYHYPVCSLHSKPNFVLPDFSQEEIKFDNIIRNKTYSTSAADIYKTDIDFISPNTTGITTIPLTSSRADVNKKRNQSVNSGKANSNVRINSVVEKKEKEERKVSQQQFKHNKVVKENEVKSQPKPVNVVKQSEIPTVNAEPPITIEPASVENQNLLRDWVNLSNNQLVDTKSLENTLQNDFVNGFDINSSSIQSQIQDMINSEPSLSTDMLMGSHELPNYIQVEEMIEEVEITDEALDSNELNNNELVQSEDLNAVLKQLPPEAFNELFSDKNDSHWSETQALERVIEEMDVRKCALIDPSLLLEDIESPYTNYTNNYDNNSLTGNTENKFNDAPSESTSRSLS